MKNLFRGLIVVAIGAAALAVVAMADDKDAVKSETTAPAISSSAYPLDVCIVSGEKLGAMGDPVVKTYDGREVKFCCPMCPPRFEKDQKAYTKKLDDAIVAAQKPNYPLETCVVSGEELAHSDMGDPVDYVYQNRLIRFCCNNCVKAFNKNPSRFLEKLDAAQAAGKTAEPESAPEEQKQ
jgi:YHS domain-containing protein